MACDVKNNNNKQTNTHFFLKEQILGLIIITTSFYTVTEHASFCKFPTKRIVRVKICVAEYV